MSAPRTKRQFAGAASDPAQRQITSFFASTGLSTPAVFSSGAPSLNYDPRASQLPSGPSLPASVQTNLLSVGMRVRKSVPEGYKTGMYSAFALFDESDGPSATAGMCGTSPSSEGRSRANAFSSPRELLPFCGIHKVGGLATQPEDWPATSMSADASYRPLSMVDSNDAGLAAVAADDVPGLTSSQDSVASTTGSTASGTRKRSFAEEDDEDNDNDNDAPMTPGQLGVWGAAGQYDGEISPRSLAPPGGWGSGRVMAVPRKGGLRNRLGARPGVQLMDGAAAAAAAAAGLKGLGQENVMITADGDFDEADFLDGPRGWEVEMSDI